MTGKALSSRGETKEDGSTAKPKPAVLKSETPMPEEEEEEDESADGDDDDEDMSEDDDSASNNEAMPDAGDDSDEDEDDSSDDKGVTLQKCLFLVQAKVGKKRASSEKKAKLVTPPGRKIDVDGNKGGHVATPYPKKAAKTSITKEKSKQQTPNLVLLCPASPAPKLGPHAKNSSMSKHDREQHGKKGHAGL